jgi:hypothetical protein
MLDTILDQKPRRNDAPSRSPAACNPPGLEHWMRSNPDNGLGSERDDCMACCFAHLQSALSGIEGLLEDSATSRSDRIYFALASRSVSVALDALDEGNPALSRQQPNQSPGITRQRQLAATQHEFDWSHKC